MRRAGILLVVLLVLGACGGDDGGDDRDDAAPRSTTTEPAPEQPEPATPAPTAPAPTVPFTGAASCADGSADTSDFTPGADLLGVELAATDGGLTIRYRLVGPVPTTGTTLWSVFARAPGGANIQFGARLEGDTRSPFVYRFGDDLRQDLPPETMVVGPDSIEVAYPETVVGSLRAPFDWRAESTVEVRDVDWCPGGADQTVLDDDRLPFTG